MGVRVKSGWIGMRYLFGERSLFVGEGRNRSDIDTRFDGMIWHVRPATIVGMGRALARRASPLWRLGGGDASPALPLRRREIG